MYRATYASSIRAARSSRRCTGSASSIVMRCARRTWLRIPDASPPARCSRCCRSSSATNRAIIDHHRCEVGHDGARRAPQLESAIRRVNEELRAYNVGKHRTRPRWSRRSGIARTRNRVLFVPHLLRFRAASSPRFSCGRARHTEQDVRNAFEASFCESRASSGC